MKQVARRSPNQKGTGRAMFWLNHPSSPRWWADVKGYQFNPVTSPNGRLVVAALKYPDGTIEIGLQGLLGQRLVFRHRIPRCNHRGLHVHIEWDRRTVKLLLNGLAATSMKI